MDHGFHSKVSFRTRDYRKLPIFDGKNYSWFKISPSGFEASRCSSSLCCAFLFLWIYLTFLYQFQKDIIIVSTWKWTYFGVKSPILGTLLCCWQQGLRAVREGACACCHFFKRAKLYLRFKRMINRSNQMADQNGIVDALTWWTIENDPNMRYS